MASKISIFLFFIFLFLFFFQPIETEDVWWHLATGKWITEHLQVPHEDPFPFAGERTPWTCTHWLGSTLLYLVYKAGGLLGLKVFRSIFFVLVIGLFFVYSAKRLPLSFLLLLALLLSCALINRSFLRPDILNFIFVQLFLINLFIYERNPEPKRLFILPLLGILWGNSHLGSFVYGTLLISIFFLSACVRCMNFKIGQGGADQKAEARAQMNGLGLTLAIYVMVFLISPYGVEGFLYPFKVFLFPHFLDFYKIGSVIEEAQPPGHMFLSFTNSYYFFALFILGLWVLFLNKKNNFTLAMLFIFALFMFLYMSRNGGFFALVAVYVIAQGAGGIGMKAMWEHWHWSKLIDRYFFVWLAVFLTMQMFDILHARGFYRNRGMPYLLLESNPYSAAAVQLLKDKGIIGPVFNSNMIGGQMIWSGYPQLRPFDDGRHVDKQRFNNFIALLLAPEKYWSLAEEHYGFKIVMLNSSDGSEKRMINYLNANPAWQLMSVQGPLIVYVKKKG